MEVSTLGNIVVSTLFTLGRPSGGKDYTWMKQQAVEFIAQRFPKNGCLQIGVDYMQLSPTNKVYTLPNGALTATKIGYLCGDRVYSLTMDGDLALPNMEEFMCDGFPNSERVNGFFPNFLGSFNAVSYSAATGGRNVNYYRRNGRQIIFSNDVPNGKLVIEYVGMGNVDENTMIELAYVPSVKYWLTKEFYLYKGDVSRVTYFETLYNDEVYNTNALLFSPTLSEITDAVRRSTHFSLG